MLLPLLQSRLRVRVRVRLQLHQRLHLRSDVRVMLQQIGVQSGRSARTAHRRRRPAEAAPKR